MNSTLIDNIISALEQAFDRLIQSGYHWEPLETYNRDDPKHHFVKSVLKNDLLNRKLLFTVYLQATITIDAYPTDLISGASFSFKSFINHSKHPAPGNFQDTPEG